ncbi:MAG: alpha-L-fucosidase [Planctomycetota bacterium]|nr:alpha-L-fucosidase [Planctomycetota bacterium]
MRHNERRWTLRCWIGMFLVLASSGYAAEQPWDMLTAQPEVVRAWQDLRFGMFLCWGPVSLTGQEIGWSRGAPRGHGWLQLEGQGPTPGELYDNLYKTWKPARFDARQWVQIARDAGQQYLIFLVKHHDGFCLYDSQLTEYKSTGPASAWTQDVLADVARECQAAGLKLIVYYSQPDWHHPDYGTENHARYIAYLHGQVCEILTHYGRIDGFWFDLGGKPEDWDSVKLFQRMRTLQPWLIINNRCGLPGDYDTPEQRLGGFRLDRPWETCMTLGTQWSWKPDDQVKSLKQCIDVLVTCAGRNGNLALNTNPMPDGQIEPRQAERFREIGGWLKQYGQTIAATRGGPFWGLHCASTRKHNTVYVHILKWYGDKLLLPAIPTKIVSHCLLTGGTATVCQTADQIEILVPREQRQELDTIVALELDGPASELEPAQILSGSLTFGKPVTASSVYPDPVGQQYLPAFAVDGDADSGWTFAPTLKSAWLEVDLGQPTMFDTADIHERYDRIRSFRLQMKQGEQWLTIHEGARIGENLSITFPPVTAQFVRLEVLDTTINPLVDEFHVFRSK